MIMCLHGGPTNSGITAASMFLLEEPSNREIIPLLFQCVVVAPYCENDWWSNLPLLDVVQEVAANHRVDTQRIYVIGGSMGGFGAWSFASAYSEWVAAAIPICGAGVEFVDSAIHIPAVNLEPLVSIPIWAFHGEIDSVIPEAFDAETVNGLLALGGNVRYTVYPDVGHDAVTPTVYNPEIYEWLLQQSKANPSAVTFYQIFQ